MILSSLIDWFIPTGTRDSVLFSANRARVTVGYVLVMLCCVPVYSAFYFSFGSAGAAWPPIVGAPFGIFILVIIKKKRGSTRLIGNSFVASLAIIFFAISYSTGGFLSPAIVWFVILPIIAFFTACSTSGTLWCFFTMLIYLGYYVAFQWEIPFPQDLSDANYNYTRFLGLLSLIPLIYSFFYIVDFYNRRARDIIQSREKELSRIQRAIDESSEAIGIFSPEKIPFYLSKRFIEFLQIPEGNDMSGVTLTSHHVDQTISNEINRKIKTGHSWSGEAEIIDNNGVKTQTLSRLDIVRDGRGEITAYIRTMTDISHQKEVENALKESQERYRFLIEKATDVIWIRDMDFKLKYISPAVERMRGFTPEEAMKLSLEESVTPESIKRLPSILERELSNADDDPTKESMTEVEMYHKDGSTLWVEVKATFIRDESQKPSAIIGISRDITERKRAEDRLRTAQNKLLRNAHRAGMADIAADTLHNIGNLMNSVKTSTHVIKEIVQKSSLLELKKANDLIREEMGASDGFVSRDPRGKLLMKYYLSIEEKMESDNKLVIENINRLNAKIETISDVVSAQQTYAGLSFFVEKCSLSHLVEDVLTIQSELLESNAVSIGKKFDDVPEVSVQKTKLVYVLVNLIQNAVESMVDTPKQERAIRIEIKEVIPIVRLMIEDTGIGISTENLRKIFTHGFTTKEDGNGFGLHNCANHMSEMEGKIWAESDGENRGARFYLDFPIARQ